MKSAKDLVAQANRLHAEALTQRKFVDNWWNNCTDANEAFYAASKKLSEEATPNSLTAWHAAYKHMKSFNTNDSPRADPAADAWWKAKNEAEEALCEEAGLIRKLKLEE